MSIFNSIKVKRPKRSLHDLSYSNRLDVGFGELTPMMMEKTIPGDKFKLRDEFMCRFAPFYGQVFQAFKLRTEYMYVPSRLLWKNFELFLSNGLDGTKTDYVHPYIDYRRIVQWRDSYEDSLINTVFDFFNFETDSGLDGAAMAELRVDALPFYALAKAFIDYYADENLDYMPLIALFESGLEYAVDGDNTGRVCTLFGAINMLADLTDEQTLSNWLTAYRSNTNFFEAYTPSEVFCPFRRSYPKDYFTSALPFAQRGPIVQIPMNGEGDVVVSTTGRPGYVRTNYSDVQVKVERDMDGNAVSVSLYETGSIGAETQGQSAVSPVSGQTYTAYAVGGTYGSGGTAAANQVRTDAQDHQITFRAVNVNGTATITDLRTAFTVQNWLEKKARSGVRPKENIFSSFGVRTKDYRLDRAEFIHGFSSTVKIGEIFTTVQDDAGDFVPGLGVSVGQLADASKPFKKFFEEHGYFFGFVSIYPTAAYFQGVPRQFMELDLFDYFWPEFQHLGEQPIYNCELKIDDEGMRDKETFGYTPRYAQYKFRNNQIHGSFRESLKFMTAAREFGSVPRLNNGFIQINPSTNGLYRVFNFTGDYSSAKPCYIDIYHHNTAMRPMDYYGNPRLI